MVWRRLLLGLAVAGTMGLLLFLLVLQGPPPPEERSPNRDAEGRVTGTAPAADDLAEGGSDTEDPILVGRPGQETGASEPDVPTSRLEGRVVDCATRRGISGTRVIAFTARDRRVLRVARSDEEGRFALERLVPGLWWLLVWHPEYVPAGLDRLLGGGTGSPWEVMELEVPESGGVLPPRVLELSAGRRVQGHVVDPAGRPVADARILLQDGEWREALEGMLRVSLYDWQRYIPLRSDAQGRFALACLPPALGSTRLGAAGEGFVSRWSEPIALEPGAPVAEIVLQAVPTASVSGNARLPDGTPAWPVEVSVCWSALCDLREIWAMSEPDDVAVNPDGSYRILGLPPDAVTLDADWREPYASGASLEFQPLAPGEERAGVDFTLPERHILTGRLEDTAGGPLPCEILLVRDTSGVEDSGDDAEEPFEDTVRTEEDGAFAVSVPTSGPLEILHLAPDGNNRVLLRDLQLPAEPLTLSSEATPLTRIELRVRDPDGALVLRFRSAVQSLASRSIPHRRLFDSDVDGKNGVAVHPVPGEAPFTVLVAIAQDADRRLLELGSARLLVKTVPPDGVVEVRLHAADVIFGRIVGPDGRAVPGVSLTLVRTDLEEPSAAERISIPLDPDGRFSHRTGADCSSTLQVEVEVPPGYTAVPAFDPRQGERTPTIVLQPGGTLAGRVLAPGALSEQPNGEPLHVFVHWRKSEGRPSGSLRAPIDAEGRWRAEGVPLGTDLTATVPALFAMQAGFCAPERLEGLRSGDMDVVIRLVAGLTISGMCTEADGTPPRSASLAVVARPLGGMDGTTGFSKVSATDGRFAVSGLVPGTYRVLLLDTGTRMLYDERRLEAGTGNVRFGLPERGSLSLSVHGGEFEFGLHVTVWVSGTTTRRGSMAFAGKPPFVLEGLPANETSDLVVLDSSYPQWVGTVGRVRVGDEVAVTLVESVLLSGRLRRADGTDRPFRGDLYARRDAACFDLWLSEKGTFGGPAGANVAPGRYELCYVAEDGTTTVLARDVEAGREDLDLVLP